MLYPVASTLVVDLSTSWSTSNVRAISNTKPTDMPNVRRPCLWYNPVNGLMYEWGGWSEGSPGSGTMWTFEEANGSQWEPTPAPSTSTSLSALFGSSWISSPSSFYSIGGAIPGGYASIPTIAIGGIVSFNFSSNTWTNGSSDGLPDSSFSVMAESVFVPNFGPSGLLITLGGDSPPNDTYHYEKGAALTDMSNVTVYDIASEKWYHQTATGAVPPGRSEFCMIGAMQSDNTTYEM